jgi:hypothetical protein
MWISFWGAGQSDQRLTWMSFDQITRLKPFPLSEVIDLIQQYSWKGRRDLNSGNSSGLWDMPIIYQYLFTIHSDQAEFSEPSFIVKAVDRARLTE